MGDEADRPLATFRSGHSLAVEQRGDGEAIVVRAKDGSCVLSVEMTDQGPVLKLSGMALEVTASSSLSLKAERLEVSADSASFDIAGDLVERVGGDVRRSAREVQIAAELGGIELTANDDVDIKGERVRLNSPEPPMALSWQEYREREAARLGEAAPAGEADDDG